jgi:outer membrane lipoprotein carrier protein
MTRKKSFVDFVKIIAVVFSLGSVFPAVPSACAQGVDEAVIAVEKHYQDLTDLSAKVTQKNHFKSLGKTQTFEGALLIKKPGKLRLEYTNGQLILVDGKEALIYMKKSDEMIKKTFTDFEHMNIPVAFLLGAAAHIRDDFDALQPDPKTPRTFELIPKKGGAAMKKLVLVSDDAGRITAMTIYDRSGNVTEIGFTDVREGVGLDDKLFSFTPPKGTEIIEQ